MPKASVIIPALNAGQLSPLLEGRVDFAKYPKGLKLCDNWVPTPQGPVIKRPGTKFVATSKDSTKKSRLVPFEFSTEAAYILEFSDQRIRFYKNEQIITATAQNITGVTQANPAVVTYSGSDTYANGDRVIITGVVGMTELNNREFTVANVNTGANTFELSGVNSSAFTAYSSGGTVAEIIEITTAYTESQIFELDYTQSLDTLYIAHRSHAPRKLTRTSDTAWTIQDINFFDGPYSATNTASYKTITVASTVAPGVLLDLVGGTVVNISGAANNGSGLIRITTAATNSFLTGDRIHIANVTGTTEANGVWTITVISNTTFDLQGSAFVNVYAGAGSACPAIFENAVVGMPIAIFGTNTANIYGWGTVSTATSARQVTILAKQTTPNAATLTSWRIGAWSSTLGYPSAVAFFGDRLYWGGGGVTRQLINGSCVGDFENMSPAQADGTVTDDKAVNFTLGGNQASAIRWMVSDEKGLIVGTQSNEWVLRASNAGEAITPSNVNASQSTNFGSPQIKPVVTDKATVFVQRGGKKIRELLFSFDQDGFETRDMTVASENITSTGVTQLAFMPQPYPIVWATRIDGKLIGMSYDRENELLAWHQHSLGGTDVVVESVAVIPNPNQDGDQLWLMVKRTINGATVRTIEYMEDFWVLGSNKTDAHFVDCGAVYSGSATTSVTGVNWLPSTSVTILANGASHAAKTVSSGGTVTTDVSVTSAHVGLGYTADGWTERLEAGAADGTAQGKFKRIHQVVFRFLETLGMKFGPDVNTLDTITFRQGDSVLGSSPPLFTGDMEVKWNGGTDRDARIYFQSYQPFPAIVVAIMPDVVTHDRG